MEALIIPLTVLVVLFEAISNTPVPCDTDTDCCEKNPHITEGLYVDCSVPLAEDEWYDDAFDE